MMDNINLYQFNLDDFKKHLTESNITYNPIFWRQYENAFNELVTHSI